MRSEQQNARCVSQVKGPGHLSKERRPDNCDVLNGCGGCEACGEPATDKAHSMAPLQADNLELRGKLLPPQASPKQTALVECVTFFNVFFCLSLGRRLQLGLKSVTAQRPTKRKPGTGIAHSPNRYCESEKQFETTPSRIAPAAELLDGAAHLRSSTGIVHSRKRRYLSPTSSRANR